MLRMNFVIDSLNPIANTRECIYTPSSRSNINIVGAKFNFYSGAPTKAITSQVFVHPSWLRSLEDFGSKSTPILVRREALFPFSSTKDFPLSDSSEGPDFPFFFIFSKNKRKAEIQRLKDQKEARKKKMEQKFEKKCPKP